MGKGSREENDREGKGQTAERKTFNVQLSTLNVQVGDGAGALI